MKQEEAIPAIPKEQLSNIRRLWCAARNGDEGAANQLQMFLWRYETVDAFARAWAGAKLGPSRKPKKRSPKSTQEKFRNAILPPTMSTWTHQVGGGLPSLGKKK